jgi:ParB/RepB/Spo0J family partition protein
MDNDFATQTEPETMAGTITLECRTLVLTYAHLRVREPNAEARLTASLADRVQMSPVLVVRDADGRAVLIDGYRRVCALLRLRKDTVTAIVLGISEADALAYCHRLATNGRRSALEEGWLVRELNGQGPSLHDIGAALGRSHSWVSRRLALVHALPESVQETVRRGIIPPDSAMKSLVPLARANRAECEQLVLRLGDTRVTTRQMSQLYAALRAGDKEQRERIVQAPLLFLRAVAGRDPKEPKDEIGWLIRELGVTAAALGRVQESFERAVAVDPSVVKNPRVRRAWRPIATTWQTLSSSMEERDAGPGYPRCDLAAAG